MEVGGRTWRIGEVATATGLTVRALHHYDQIGLVVPSVRSAGGHRLYSSADIVALYQVTALRQLGLSLEQAATVLEDKADVRRVLAEQLTHVDRQIRGLQRLRGRLAAARDFDDAGSLAEIIRLMQDRSADLTVDQVEMLRRRMGDLGVVAEHAITVEMPRLYREAYEEMRSGTQPDDPTVRGIAERLDELAELIRGPDIGIGTAVRTMWVEHARRQPHVAAGGEWGDLVAYLDAARARD